MREITFQKDILPLKNTLYRLALGIAKSREEAEDIVQDTMLRAWERRSSWQEIDNIKAFLVAICRNLALDRQKSLAKRLTVSKEEANLETPSKQRSPHEGAAERDQVSHVRDIIRQLPEKQRTCIELRDFDQMAYKDIAKALDMSEQQVKVNIFRARQEVKRQFIKISDYGL